MNKVWEDWICEFADDEIMPITCETSEAMVSFEIEDRKYTLEQSEEEGLFIKKFSASQ